MGNRYAPYLAITSDDLKKPIDICEGDLVFCPNCKEQHPIEFGTNTKGEKTSMMGAVTCGEKSFLVMVGGRLLKPRPQKPKPT